MKNLARELEMVPANLYNYYPNKQEILFDVVDFALTSLLEREKALAAEIADPVRCVRAMTTDLVLVDLQDSVAAFVGYHGLNGLSGAARKRASKRMADIRNIWLEVISAGVASGDFHTPSPKLAALTILSICSFVSSWFDPQGEYTRDHVAAYTAAVALRSLGYDEPFPGQ